MTGEFRLEPLVLLLQVLDAGQVAAVVVRPDQQLLLLDPRFLIGNIPRKIKNFIEIFI